MRTIAVCLMLTSALVMLTTIIITTRAVLQEIFPSQTQPFEYYPPEEE